MKRWCRSKMLSSTVRRNGRLKRLSHVLMMRIPNPRERTSYAGSHRKVGNDSHNENSIVVVLVVDEDEGHPEDEPCEA